MVSPVTSAGSRWLVGQCCVTPYGALKPHCVTAKNNAMEEYLSEKETPACRCQEVALASERPRPRVFCALVPPNHGL